jgi:hypothetical protein
VTGNGTYDFSLNSPSGSYSTGLNFYTKENTVGQPGPRLVVTIDRPATPAIEDGLWRDRNLDLNGATPPPAEDSGVSWRNRMNAEEARFGVFDRWREYHPPGNLPFSGTNHPEEQALADGKKLFLSWKPYPDGQSWAYTAAGNYDATLNAVFTDMANDCGIDECWMAISHEPDNDDGPPGFSYANYRGMWQRVMDARDAHAPNVKLAWIMTGFGAGASESDPQNKKQDYLNLWPDDGADRPDIIGHDPYINKDTPATTMSVRIEERTHWFVNNIANKPVAIFEWGCDVGGAVSDHGTADHRADCITNVKNNLADIAAEGVVHLTYFDARSDEFAEYGPDANTPQDENAYQSLLTTMRSS